MKETKKAQSDKNNGNNPDTKNEQNGKGNKKEKKKLKEEIKDFLKSTSKRLKGIEKSQSKETTLSLHDLNTKEFRDLFDFNEEVGKLKENGKQNPDNEKKREKKKMSKWIRTCIDKILHDKEKSNSDEMQTQDHTDFEMEMIYQTHHNEWPPSLPDTNTLGHLGLQQFDEIKEEKTLLDETRELMALEREIHSSGYIDDQRRNEVETRCTDLEEKLFRVIEDSLSNKDVSQIKDAIQAIMEQERQHQGRPKWPWKIKWKESVAFSVVERVNRLLTLLRIAPGSCMSQMLGTLGKAMKNDLIHIIENLKPLYPEEFDVCNVYAQQYHHRLQCELRLVTQNELNVSEIHCVLSWIKTIYPGILRAPALVGHINVDQLGDLLSSEMVCYFENMYIFHQQKNVEDFMTKALDMEINRWKEGRKPEMIESTIHSDLPVDICQIYNSEIKAAREISTELTDKVTSIQINEFQEFLYRYERSYENFHRMNTGKPYFKETVIANMKCCSDFRGFIEQTSARENIKQRMYLILTNMENQGYGVLLQDLYQDIESDIREISQNKGQNSHEIMSQVIATARGYISSISALPAPCCQVMAEKVHTHMVNEYLTNIMDIRKCNTEEQEDLAARMDNTAGLLTEFCTDHLSYAQMSEATWKNNTIRKIAEIIRLQDLNLIKLKVMVLNQEYPDIRKKEVEAFLCMKRNLKKFDRRKILEFNESNDPPRGQVSINTRRRSGGWFKTFLQWCLPCCFCCDVSSTS